MKEVYDLKSHDPCIMRENFDNLLNCVIFVLSWKDKGD